MSGFLRGFLRDEPIETCCAWANACGAFAVSRLLCSPESPTFPELQYFLKHGSQHHALRHDVEINHVHWATTRRPQPAGIMALAIDHRAQLEDMADAVGAPRERIAAFKSLAVAAAARVAAGRPGFGMLIDGKHGREALFRAGDHGFWIARPLELPGSRPLELETDATGSLGATLAEWPVDHIAKCLCFYHPDDPAELKAEQEAVLKRVALACRQVGRELLVEIIASKHGPLHDDSTALVMERLYAIGIRPDWWKLETQPSPAAWQAIDNVIATRDPYCRGVLLLGLDAPEDIVMQAFRGSRNAASVKGFAVGRTIFGEVARAWLSRAIDDEAATVRMAQNFGKLAAAWESR